MIEMYIVNYGSPWESHIILNDDHVWSPGAGDVQVVCLNKESSYLEKGRRSNREIKQGHCRQGSQLKHWPPSINILE